MKIVQLNNIITKIKILLDKLNSRAKMTEDRISELEDRSKKFTQDEQRENRLGKKKKRKSQRPVGQKQKITGVPEGESKWD